MQYLVLVLSQTRGQPDRQQAIFLHILCMPGEPTERGLDFKYADVVPSPDSQLATGIQESILQDRPESGNTGASAQEHAGVQGHNHGLGECERAGVVSTIPIRNGITPPVPLEVLQKVATNSIVLQPLGLPHVEQHK